MKSLNASLICTTLILMLLLSGCFSLLGPGPNSLIRRALNSTKTKQAILFLKGGNATADDSLQISIKDASDSLNETEVGNTFTTDSDHGKAILNASAISLYWKDNDHLVISYDKRLRTFFKNKNVEDVEIMYQAR
ncbi:hypothetical protein [Mucilaginibacter sp. CSA2-8R]|uniref:hypothetical protein n=1 Tax=Mucilaginibacter sp. CSA2-8R TaxID=3141542 RepID=UPI00315D369A